MNKGKMIRLILVVLLIVVGFRVGYLTFKYPSFTDVVFPSEKPFTYQGYDYEISNGEVLTKKEDQGLEGMLIDDQVALRFNLKTTDLRIISDYLLYIDGHSFYPSYELLEKINNNEYVLSYTVSENLVVKKDLEAYIALPSLTVKNQTHAVIKVNIVNS